MSNPILNAEQFQQAVRNFDGSVDRLAQVQTNLDCTVDRFVQAVDRFTQAVERMVLDAPHGGG